MKSQICSIYCLFLSFIDGVAWSLLTYLLENTIKKLLEFVYTCKFGGNIKFGVTHIIRYPVLVFVDVRNIITFTSFYKFAMAINYIAIYHSFT